MQPTLAQLIRSAAEPVLELALMGGVGALLAHKTLLDHTGCTLVAKLSFQCFIPALVFSNLISTTSLSAIHHLWPLLLNMTISIIIGLFNGWLFNRTLNTPHHHRSIITAAIAFGNVGNVPLVYVYSLCSDKSSMFWNTLGEACRETGVAYTSLDMMVATLLQFSLASWLLNPESPYNDSQRKKHASSLDLMGGGRGVEEEGEGEGLIIVQDGKQKQQGEDIELIPVAHYGNSSGTDHKSSIVDTCYHAISKYNNGTTSTSTTTSPPNNNNNNNNNNKSIDWYSLFPLPTQASVAGIIIGCIAPAKSFFTHTLHPVFQTLTVLGDAAVPLSVPLLGAVIYRGPGKSSLSYKTMIGVIVVRLVLQPALMTGLVMGMVKSGLLPELDAMAVLTMLLANAVPTAINMSTFVVLYDHGVQEMSAILFWEYMCALMTLPAWMWLFLRIIGEGD